MSEPLIIAFWLWVCGLVLALARAARAARWLIVLGTGAGIWGAAIGLPRGESAMALPIALADQVVRLRYAPEALWLLGFGLLPAGLAIALATPIRKARPAWLVGAALSLIGAIGVFGLQDAYSFLIAWELMSIGGAVLILSERTSAQAGRGTLYMLALLEVGVVGILLALLLLAQSSGTSVAFDAYTAGAHTMSSGSRIAVGLLTLFGFGAKLGLLPFYEWFPGAYGNARSEERRVG